MQIAASGVATVEKFTGFDDRQFGNNDTFIAILAYIAFTLFNKTSKKMHIEIKYFLNA